MWIVILQHPFIHPCPKKKQNFPLPMPDSCQQVRWLRAERSSAARCIPWAGVPVLRCSPREDADGISLPPWEFTRSVCLTNHHKQLNLSPQLDSAPIRVPADFQQARLGPQCLTEVPLAFCYWKWQGGKGTVPVTTVSLGFPSQAKLIWITG